VVRIQPDGGFVARIVEPEHALVLYLDDDIARQQAQALLAAKAPGAAARMATEMEDMPGFRATWSLILEPETGDRTRLIGASECMEGRPAAPAPPLVVPGVRQDARQTLASSAAPRRVPPEAWGLGSSGAARGGSGPWGS
jgi:hypothetical protein